MTTNNEVNWGEYEPAIRRWESVHDHPAPSPTILSTKGNPRLNPVFSEWMMGATPGWITDTPGISTNDMHKIIGNGVVTLQAVTALRDMLGVAA